MRYFVTGGAGFIGSHLVDRLVDMGQVTVYDNLSSGRKEFIECHLGRDDFRFIEANLMELDSLKRAMKDNDVVLFDIETTGLNPFSEDAKIITAQLTINDGNIIILKEWELGEKGLINELAIIFSELSPFSFVYIYNAFFDVTYLLGRIGKIFKGKKAEKLYHVFRMGIIYRDLMQFNNGYLMSLEKACRRHGLRNVKKSFSGRQMIDFYNKKDYDSIIAHAIEDIKILKQLRNVLGDKI